VKPLAVCGNCGHVGRTYVPLNETPALSERLTPGAEVPAGECEQEDCSALVYLKKDEPAPEHGGCIFDHDHAAEPHLCQHHN
jgi:hypothetical protein